MQNQTQSQNKDFDSKKVTKKVIFSKINVALFIFVILNVILMALFYFALKNKLQDKKILGSGKIWNIVHKCSSEHPESCDKSCNANSDCYPSCTRDCGCLKSGEVCDDDENTIQCEVAPFSCECKNNTCEIVEYEKETGAAETFDQKINIIGNYVNAINSMCSQNCDRYYIGTYTYELADELQDVDGNNKEEIIFASGKMEKIIEPPTIAGPDSDKQNYDKEIESTKLKIDNYKKINFPKISISEEELSNYLNNKDSKFILEFENPLDEELKFKARMNDGHDFQHFVLQPKETKAFEYIYAKDPENAREEDDGFNLVIINDFVDDSNFRNYYFDEANNINSAGTMIYIEKYVRLEDCKTEIDASDWQTYKNEEFDFEVKYPGGWHQKEGVSKLKKDRWQEKEGYSFIEFSSNVQFPNWSEKESVITIDIISDFDADLQVWFDKSFEYCKKYGCAPSHPFFDSYIAINGEPAIKALEDHPPGTAGLVHVFCVKNNTRYDLSLELPDTNDEALIKNHKDIFDVMISTFKFTNEK